MFTDNDHSRNYMFYASLLSRCKLVFDDNFDAPAAIHFDVDKYVLTINNSVFSDFSILIRIGILKHEALHIINKHIERFSKIGYTKLVNYACDCSINQFIMPEHLPYDHISLEFLSDLCGEDLEHNQSAEYYYNKISHLEDENIDNNWGESNIVDDNTIDFFTDTLIDEAIEDTKNMNGRYPKINDKKLGLIASSIVDWKRHLRKIFTSQRQGKIKTNKKPSRRFPKREDIQGVKKDSKFNILVVADVSASVSDKETIELMSSIKSIHSQCAKMSKMTVIQVDTVAYTPEEFTKNTNIMTRKGKGGTALYPAIERAKQDNIQYDCVLVLTDGYLFKDDVKNFENDKYNTPIMWMISKKGNKSDNLLHGSTSKKFTVLRL